MDYNLMITVTLNGKEENITTVEDFGVFLDKADNANSFELWLTIEEAQSICMLRNKNYSWLMYLRYEGDSGFHSLNNLVVDLGTTEFKLNNGQIDKYPSKWCIETELCYKALSYFWVNSGEKPDWIQWEEEL